jgi:transcriptional regulator GlxA family with amidase domain
MIAFRLKWLISLIYRHGTRRWPAHDRRADLSGFPAAGRRRADLGIRHRWPLREKHNPDQGDRGKGRSRALVLRRRDDGPEVRPRGRATTLIIAGGDGVDAAARNKCTIRFVQNVAKRGTRVASVCSGTFILAEAGLLDGRRATTHWGRTRQFLSTYPRVKLEPDQIFVRDGEIWSSAGITAGIDLALAMVAEDYGDEVVQKTARQLVLYHRRSGGQSQFSSLLELKAPTGRFGPLLTWAREHLDKRLTVDDLAERAGMSSRHFARAFMAETGTTPSKAIERLRIEVARAQVQSTSEAIERVAETTGFGDPERMRRAFIRTFGQPPQSLRRAARTL